MPIAPPRPKGPHLNCLRAFESAARLGSFTAAAEELNVTPGAIAQHVKSLEAWAGSRLFARNTRGVVLTPLGEELLPEFTLAFDQLSNAVQALRTKAAPQKVTVVTLPAIAQLWLSERLGMLRKLMPELTISVVAVERMPNLSREPYDIALFFEDIPPGEGDVVVFQDCIYPVCNAEIGSRIETVMALERETLLHDSAWADDWSLWLDSVPDGKKVKPKGPTYSLFSVALEEARSGAGVLMAHDALVETALQAGDLVAPFEHRLTIRRWLVMKTSSAFDATKSGETFKAVFCGGV